MSRIVVQKFGGSSVADAEKIRKVAARVKARRDEGWRLVVVVSAMGDTTDELLSLAKQISADPPRRELDMLLSCGERISMALLSMALNELGVAAISFTVQGPHGLTLSAYSAIFASPGQGQTGLGGALVYSLEIAVATIVITLALMLPTQLLLHLRLPRWRGLVEVLSVLPLVFPPVDLRVIAPALVLAATGIIVMLADLLPPRDRKDHLGLIGLVGVVASLLLSLLMWGVDVQGFRGMVALDEGGAWARRHGAWGVCAELVDMDDVPKELKGLGVRPAA